MGLQKAILINKLFTLCVDKLKEKTPHFHLVLKNPE